MKLSDSIFLKKFSLWIFQPAEKPGKITFEINRLNLTSGITVSDQEALIAMNTAFKHLKIVLEPSVGWNLLFLLSKSKA